MWTKFAEILCARLPVGWSNSLTEPFGSRSSKSHVGNQFAPEDRQPGARWHHCFSR